MATASSSWMPAQGRHNVGIGSSLAKALKARKGQPPQRNKNLPERDFYTLRYNHKPPSIDPAKPGTLEVNPGREVSAVRVERPTTNSNEVVVFKGDEKPAKEWDCVLIYDEATQTFTLEKLDSLVNLNFDGKAQPRARPTASRTFPPSHLPQLRHTPVSYSTRRLCIIYTSATALAGAHSR
ncbi:RNA polymerase II transcription elongation factor-domain-containing protein [Lactarius sanguifluus]|nr:RNA polymerase II transcription elongation factor-domain-containing protein [Lactarius sanguifluus]